ncbi:MAG: LptF/LptG family permease, partial [Flavobacteriaceae bacterium]
MKILDRYILTTYLKTFISVFVILMLIFVLQTIWLYIKELAGKDLDIIVIAKFLIYFTPKLIPLVLPLTILLASIMVFGNFAENYEFAAMKSTGISLQRAMASLSVFIVILGVVTFFFSNNVIPWAEYNSFNLRKNIAKLKPAMAIAEGQFNE